MNVPEIIAAVVRAGRARTSGSGRHRFGRPGLTHCRALPSVDRRIVDRRSYKRTGSLDASRPRPALPARRFAAAAALSAVTAVLVSGWYAAAGASAIALMLSN